MSQGRCWKSALVVGMLVFGSVNTLTKKFQMESCGKSIMGRTSEDAEGRQLCPKGEEKFSKPWSQNIMMFIGEGFLITLMCCQRRPTLPVDDSDAKNEESPHAPFYIFGIPALCDVIGTGIGGIGMLFVSAAVWQMMRGSIIIFTSVFSVFFLQKTLYLYHWLAVLVSVCGISMVGTSAFMNEGVGGSGSNILFGIACIMLAQVFAAFQMITEELFVKGYGTPPAQVVGSEGMWGMFYMVVLLTTFYLVPGQDNGSYENFSDTVYKVIQSPYPLDVWCLAYLVSIGIYNFLGVSMAGQLSSVHRTLVDALRTAMVWLVELAIFYGTESSFCSPAGQLRGQCFGTQWGKWSLLQLVGFLVIVFGTLMYNGIIRVPKLYYPSSEESKLPSSAGYASPLQMMLSPVTRRLSRNFTNQLSTSKAMQDDGKTEFEAHLLADSGEL